MIGWLRGRAVARLPDGEVIVDVGGVGYRVSVPAPLLATFGSGGAEVELHVHTHVREDAIVLYGFADAEQRQLFEALIGAHGVGPSLALAVLSSLTPGELVRAVLEEDLDVLCAVPGIGRKTAARLVLDLRSRLQMPQAAAAPVPGSSADHFGTRHDVRAALSELGYGADEIRQALASVPAEGAVEDVLRQALRELAGAR